MTLKEKLSKIQQEIKVPKSKRNEFGNFNYRSAEDILKAFKKFEEPYKVLLKFDDDIVNVGSSNYIISTAILYDLESDEFIPAKASAKEPTQAKAKMDDSQTTGSTSSYARKYALNGLLLLDDAVDPDSNQAIDTGEPANEAQINTIKKLCQNHDVNISKLYKQQKVNGIPTAAQAGKILNMFKRQFGDV